MKLHLLKEAVLGYLLKLLGVEEVVHRAFVEGWNMRGDTDHYLVRQTLGDQFHMINGASELDKIIHKTRCWRSVDEAWANSDAQEVFE